MAAVAGDTLAGGGALVALIYFLVALSHRTRDADNERKRLAQLSMDIAANQERKAAAERDAALAEARDLRAVLEEIREAQQAEARRRRRWWRRR